MIPVHFDEESDWYFFLVICLCTISSYLVSSKAKMKCRLSLMDRCVDRNLFLCILDHESETFWTFRHEVCSSRRNVQRHLQKHHLKGKQAHNSQPQVLFCLWLASRLQMVVREQRFQKDRNFSQSTRGSQQSALQYDVWGSSPGKKKVGSWREQRKGPDQLIAGSELKRWWKLRVSEEGNEEVKANMTHPFSHEGWNRFSLPANPI